MKTCDEHVHGVGGEGFGAVPLLQQEGGVVTGNSPGDFRHDG